MVTVRWQSTAITASNQKRSIMTHRQSASIHVCALRHVPEMIKHTDARHLVSAINAYFLPETPTAISSDRHLKLDMNDIVAAQPDLILPNTGHVAKLLEFVKSWDKQAPMLIHCYAGLSRSTAAAFIALCALNPRTPEVAIAHALRRSSDTATPQSAVRRACGQGNAARRPHDRGASQHGPRVEEHMSARLSASRRYTIRTG